MTEREYTAEEFARISYERAGQTLHKEQLDAVEFALVAGLALGLAGMALFFFLS